MNLTNREAWGVGVKAKCANIDRRRYGAVLMVACFAAMMTCSWAAAPAQVDVRRDATVNAIEIVIPSVVNIATETVVQRNDWYEQIFRGFYGWPRQQRQMNLGSGVIIDEEGYVLTNFHVISRADRVQVKLWDGREYEADRIVATASSDVALVKIRAKPGERFKAIKLAQDDDLLLGETVLALGNPFGLGGTVTRGILSSKNRRPATGDDPLNVEDWLQTDAAINPGNSGGPLVNLRGELIGLNVAVHRDQSGERGAGIGFSIPVKQVAAAVSRFFSPEVTDSLWFGAQLRPGTKPLTVSSVQKGSPAAQAGLKAGDRVTRINGQQPEGLIAFNRVLASSAGLEAKVQVQRGSQNVSVNLRLIPFEDMVREKLGMTLLEPSAQAASRFGVNTGEGLFIETVEKGGPAGKAGLERGFLLTGIQGVPTTDLRVVGEALSGKEHGQNVRLTVVVPRRLGASYVEFRQAVVDLQVR